QQITGPGLSPEVATRGPRPPTSAPTGPGPRGVSRDMIGFRHTDPRFPFLWEEASQPAARWHAAGEGPVHYFCDTPDGAWAEFLRHEEITDPADLITIRRTIWAVDLGEEWGLSGTGPRGPPAGGRDR